MVAPLDWGLGHTSRCVPIILALQKMGMTVVCAATPMQIAFLQQEVQQVQFVAWNGYNIRYAKSGWATLFLLLWQVPKIAWCILQEHRWLQTAIDNLDIAAVVSDNRYGLWSKKVPCVFVTHQLQIPVPVGKCVINQWNHFFINQYNYCWLPDDAPQGLSGTLSKVPQKLQHKILSIGLLSRLEKNTTFTTIKNSIVLLLGGPEPQRGLLQQLVQNQIENLQDTVTILGSSKHVPQLPNKNINYIPMANTLQVQTALLSAETIICRSGYSSLLDLAAVGKSAIVIPTPGQAEQLYLANYCAQKKWHIVALQHSFSLEKSKQQLLQSNLTSLIKVENNLLASAIEKLLVLCKKN